MSDIPLDTNVIVRYLVEDPEEIDPKFQGVYSFFGKVETGRLKVHVPELVIFQAYFVLTSYYEVPGAEAAEKLRELVQFQGVEMPEKAVVSGCLERLKTRNMDLVDSYILSWSEARGITSVYSFDTDLEKEGLELLPVR